MQYTCIHCSSMGANGTDPFGDGLPCYNCHVCYAQRSMWPTELAQQHMKLIADGLKPLGNDHHDRLAVSALQTKVNQLREVINNQSKQLAIAVDIVDEILPQAGNLCIDIGRINKFLMVSRK